MPDSSENAGRSQAFPKSRATEPAEFPTRGRLLGLDYGTKRVGIALTNPEQTIASPLENYTRSSEPQDARRLQQIVQEYRVAGLVVGLPLHARSGDEGEKAREARKFGTWASAATGLPVCFWDERYTTAIAEMHLLSASLSKKKRQARLDKLAAQIMLQSYLQRDQCPHPT